ncbi:MAG: hypothetical protein LQ350_005230 [Teloschistes chrysophthalmus]|nr:MAG: hypothetical protein LQ350_005230 [Niorma chrysophthalma]
MAMQICTLGFPISQILKQKRGARETNRVLAEFDEKRLGSSVDSDTVQGSERSVSLKSKQRGKMQSMESLDECLAGNRDSLQIYASVVELNGENIVFLGKVHEFRQAWQKAFHSISLSADESRRARDEMFRHALSIFVTLVHSGTASFPINIESPIYNHLVAIFGPATALVAKSDGSSRASSLSTTSTVTPWDEPQALSPVTSPTEEFASFPMRNLMKRSQSNLSIGGQSSSDRATSLKEQELEGDGILKEDKDEHDPLEGLPVPGDFNVKVFDAAYQSIRYMVWSETWQRYMVWKQKGNHDSIARTI